MTTKFEIESTVRHINAVMARVESEHRIRIGWARGGPRAYTVLGDNITHGLSPRLPERQMLMWLDAYRSGLADGVLLGGG